MDSGGGNGHGDGGHGDGSHGVGGHGGGGHGNDHGGGGHGNGHGGVGHGSGHGGYRNFPWTIPWPIDAGRCRSMPVNAGQHIYILYNGQLDSNHQDDNI